MEAVRVDIAYRPLRICWAIADGDWEAFRRAVRLNHTLWGGRYNPIVIVQRTDEARRIVDVFRADFVIPLSDDLVVLDFAKSFPYLINPLFPETLFFPAGLDNGSTARLLDVHNAILHMEERETPTWREIKSKGIRYYIWDVDDPLRDLFLVMFGEYPDAAEIGLSYIDVLIELGDAKSRRLVKDEPIPSDVFDSPTISYFPRHALSRHYSVRSNWDYPGFYLGDITSLTDLVCFWNLRATDTSLLFVDPKHLGRLSNVLPEWKKLIDESLTRRPSQLERSPSVWGIRESMGDDYQAHAARLKEIFGEIRLTICAVDIFSWNGLNIQAPTMTLGEASQMGLLINERERPSLSFSLNERPYETDIWFRAQHLVASISCIGGLYGDALHTLKFPYLPELNETFAREMYVEYNSLRLEPGRIGIVIDTSDTDLSLSAMPVDKIVEGVFKLGGWQTKPSTAGLIARQLIAQLGGLRGASVFKIPGARRLLRRYGPTDVFTRKTAQQVIGRQETGESSFGKFHDLYIEARAPGSQLSSSDVFAFLVDKGLFRIGAKLKCPRCHMSSWVSLEKLQQRVECEMCGSPFDATRQLLAGEFHFRRSGLMGAERNLQGAIPVALTLQQLQANFHGFDDHLYSTSLDVSRTTGSIVSATEVDFVWMSRQRHPQSAELIIAECKDGLSNQGVPVETITLSDVERLRTVADALPAHRFDVFVLFAKLGPFTQAEIAAASTLNGPHRQRVILLTSEQLEPWRIQEGIPDTLKQAFGGITAQTLAQLTAGMYFQHPRPGAAGAVAPRP